MIVVYENCGFVPESPERVRVNFASVLTSHLRGLRVRLISAKESLQSLAGVLLLELGIRSTSE